MARCFCGKLEKACTKEKEREILVADVSSYLPVPHKLVLDIAWQISPLAYESIYEDLEKNIPEKRVLSSDALLFRKNEISVQCSSIASEVTDLLLAQIPSNQQFLLLVHAGNMRLSRENEIVITRMATCKNFKIVFISTDHQRPLTHQAWRFVSNALNSEELPTSEIRLQRNIQRHRSLDFRDETFVLRNGFSLEEMSKEQAHASDLQSFSSVAFCGKSCFLDHRYPVPMNVHTIHWQEDKKRIADICWQSVYCGSEEVALEILQNALQQKVDQESHHFYLRQIQWIRYLTERHQEVLSQKAALNKIFSSDQELDYLKNCSALMMDQEDTVYYAFEQENEDFVLEEIPELHKLVQQAWYFNRIDRPEAFEISFKKIANHVKKQALEPRVKFETCIHLAELSHKPKDSKKWLDQAYEAQKPFIQ